MDMVPTANVKSMVVFTKLMLTVIWSLPKDVLLLAVYLAAFQLPHFRLAAGTSTLVLEGDERSVGLLAHRGEEVAVAVIDGSKFQAVNGRDRNYTPRPSSNGAWSRPTSGPCDERSNT